MGRILKGYWDCDYCNARKIGGDIRVCPNCGKPRGENTKFYMDNSSTYVNEKVEGAVSRQPDWLCGYCNNLNPDRAKECLSCGAVRNNQDLNYFQNREKKATRTQVNHGTNDRVMKTKPTGKDYFITILILFGIIGFIINGLIKLSAPKYIEVAVKSVSWERVISIEDYKTVEESGWSLPSNARLQNSNTEIRTYNKVFDHYETRTRQISEQVLDHYETRVTGTRDLGNGYFEEITTQVPIYRTEYRTETYQEPVYRNEPVYDTKYYYEIEKWVVTRSVKTSGNDKEATWGDVVLVGKEREKNRQEKYAIVLEDENGKGYKMNFDYDKWKDFEIGQTFKARISYQGIEELIDESAESTAVESVK